MFASIAFKLLAAVVVVGSVLIIDACLIDEIGKKALCENLEGPLPDLPIWLEELYVSSVTIRSIKSDGPLANLTNLRLLALENCGLRKVRSPTLSNLLKLEKLDLSHNELSELPRLEFDRLSRLATIDLSFNRIPSVTGFEGVSRVLDKLALAGNPIQFDDDDGTKRLPLVRRLDLSLNGKLALTRQGKRHSFTFSPRHWEELVTLDLSHCGLVLDKRFFRSITARTESLNLAANQLGNIDMLLSRAESLAYLNVSSATGSAFRSRRLRWKFLPVKLETLDASNLSLTSIDFSAVRHNFLAKLYADDNEIETFDLPPSLSRLIRLSLNNNRMVAVPRVTGTADRRNNFSNIEVLLLSHNDIGRIVSGQFDLFPRLKVVDLSHNNISYIDASSFPARGSLLESLDLSHNRIVSLPALNLASLTSLSLESNRLRRIQSAFFRNSPNLLDLDLSENLHLFPIPAGHCLKQGNLFSDSSCHPDWVDALSESAGPLLKTLNLAATRLSALQQSLLRSLVELEQLSLRANWLSEEQLKLWAGRDAVPPRLIYLDLSLNRLRSLGGCGPYFLQLEVLDVSLNSFICDCRMAEFRLLWRQIGVGKAKNTSFYYCFSGRNYWQYPLYSFANNVAACDEDGRTKAGDGFLTLRILLAVVSFTGACSVGYIFLRKLLPWLRRSSFSLQRDMVRCHYTALPTAADDAANSSASPTAL